MKPKEDMDYFYNTVICTMHDSAYNYHVEKTFNNFFDARDYILKDWEPWECRSLETNDPIAKHYNEDYIEFHTSTED